MKYELNIRRMDTKSILIDWPQRIDENILFDILRFKSVLANNYSSLYKNVTHTYASILIDFQNDIDFEIEKGRILELYSTDFKAIETVSKCWHIPVCYDDMFCIDRSVFEQKGIDHQTLIKLHTMPLYRVFMIGFLPGFPYL